MQAQVVDISKVLRLFCSVQELLLGQLFGLLRPASQFPSEAECAEWLTLGWKAQKSPNAEADACPRLQALAFQLLRCRLPTPGLLTHISSGVSGWGHPINFPICIEIFKSTPLFLKAQKKAPFLGVLHSGNYG